MAYRVELSGAAYRALEKLPRNLATRITTKLAALSTNPRPPGSIKLTAEEFYRIRVGDYRVIYAIEDDVLLVLVVKIADRKEAYR